MRNGEGLYYWAHDYDDAIKDWQEAEVLIKRVQYKDWEFRCDYEGIRVDPKWSNLLHDDGKLFVQLNWPDVNGDSKWPSVAEQVLDWFAWCLKEIEVHEFKEMFILDDERIYDPHSEVGIANYQEQILGFLKNAQVDNVPVDECYIDIPDHYNPREVETEPEPESQRWSRLKQFFKDRA